jgi:hypothetical protein
MQNRIEYDRRKFLHAEKVKQSQSWLMPIRQLKAVLLDIGYYDAGPVDGVPVILLHGFPYSIESYAEVAPS